MEIAEAKAQQIAEAKAAKEAEKRVKAERTERIKMQKAAEAERKRLEAAKAKAAKEAQAEKLRASRAAEKVREADNDLAHLEQRQRDLATLYSFAENEYNNATTDKQKETAFRKMMALDQQRRTTERQAERMRFIIDNGGK